MEIEDLEPFRMGDASMSQDGGLTHKGLKTPRAAAIAGIVVSVSLVTSQLLIGQSIPASPSHSTTEVVSHSNTISLAWIPFVFPAWVFLISTDILVQNLSGQFKAVAEPSANRE